MRWPSVLAGIASIGILTGGRCVQPKWIHIKAVLVGECHPLVTPYRLDRGPAGGMSDWK